MTERLHENEARVEELTKNWTSKWRETQKIIEVKNIKSLLNEVKILQTNIFILVSAHSQITFFYCTMLGRLKLKIESQAITKWLLLFIDRSELLGSDMKVLVLKWSQSCPTWSALMTMYSVQESLFII